MKTQFKFNFKAWMEQNLTFPLLLWYVFKMNHLRVTPETRPTLRSREVMVAGKLMRAMEYCDHVASQMPPVQINGQPADHKRMTRDLYYRYGLKGLNTYVTTVRLRSIHSVKRRTRRPAYSDSNKSLLKIWLSQNKHLLLLLIDTIKQG